MGHTVPSLGANVRSASVSCRTCRCATTVSSCQVRTLATGARIALPSSWQRMRQRNLHR